MLSELIIGLTGGLVIILLFPRTWLSFLSLGVSSATFVYSLFLWVNFDHTNPGFQYRLEFDEVLLPSFGVDSVGLSFVVLTSFLFAVCMLACWEQKIMTKIFVFLFLSMEVILILTFTVLDLLWFFIFFEALLIPMFLIIGMMGSRLRKIRAAYYFFLYTYTGSVLFLVAILYISAEVGSTNYEVIADYPFTLKEQVYLWLGLFFSLATKIPIWPFHIWLPEAHVEAPTSGSAILAGVLLKLGIYGFLRFSLPFFPQACYFFLPLVFTLCLVGIVYASLTAIRQTDLKRIIAYSSVAHINLVVLGIFSQTSIGLQGSMIQSISHGFVSAALFLLIGMLYDKYHTRLLLYYGGLVNLIPVFSMAFLFFSMANIGLPGTSSFVGEFLLFLGIFEISPLTTLVSATSMVLGAVYSLWLANRLLYGNLNTQYIHGFSDIQTRDVWVLVPLVFASLVIGLHPQTLMELLHPAIAYLDLWFDLSMSFWN